MRRARTMPAAIAAALSLLGATSGLAAPLDWAAVAPPAPTAGSPRDAADRAIFRQTRRLAGSARWAMAQHDADLSTGALLGDFACAVGAPLDLDRAPATAALLRGAGPEIAAAIFPAKTFYKRLRPYLRDRGAICVPRTASLDGEFDYPSGHATVGWTAGLLLAMAAPDRAGAILARARAFGESRVVCGVHNASAVEAGRFIAAAIVARRANDPDMRADLERARAEIALLRSGASAAPARCGAEAGLLATPW